MTTAVPRSLPRLLNYPHSAVFDTSSDKSLAFLLECDSWHLEDGRFHAACGELAATLALSEHTISGLVSALQSAGFSASLSSGELGGRSAWTLLSPDDGAPGRVYAYTSPLWAIMAAYGHEVDEAEHQISEALRQMILTHAEDEWLDLWGALMGVPRPASANDPDYAPIIQREAFRKRLNPLAIEQAILDHTGYSVQVEEPWHDLFRGSVSALSGSQHLYDGHRYGYHLLRPVSEQQIDWHDVLPIIERNRAAGVLVLPPEARLQMRLEADTPVACHLGASPRQGSFVTFWGESRLGYMQLSDEQVARNYPAMVTQLVTAGNVEPLLDPETISSGVAVSRASLVLSGDLALGDMNAITPRYEVDPVDVPMSLSSLARLSGYEHKLRFKPVDEITAASYPAGALVYGDVAVGWRPEQEHGYGIDAETPSSHHYGGAAFFGVESHHASPVAVSSLTLTINGWTWRDGSGWGAFTWGEEPT